MLYDYKCQNEDCGHVMEDVKQSIHDKPKKKCPNCGKYRLERIIYGGIDGFVDSGVTTVGKLADVNAKKNKSKIQEDRHRKQELAPKEELPFHHKYGGDATRQDINKMTPLQKQRYIMEGKK